MKSEDSRPDPFSTRYLAMSQIQCYLHRIQQYHLYLIILLGIYWWNSSVPDLEEKEIVVGILSARDHFDHRLAVRFTWKKFFPESKHKFVFLIGDRECDVHPDNRLSPYGCEKKDFPHEEEKESFYVTDISQNGVETSKNQGDFSIAIGLRVHFPVILQSLGVLSIFARMGKVELRDPAGKVYEKWTYRYPRHVEERPIYYTQSTEHILLPKGFEGEIVFVHDGWNEQEFYKILQSNKLLHTSECSWHQTKRVEYTFIQTPWGSTMKWMPNVCSIVTAEIVPADEEIESLEVINRRQEEWNKRIASNKEKLQTEMQQFGNWEDMLILPIQDTYESLPQKVMEFMKWSTANYKFKYLLKLDDDTFIDKKKLSKLLSENSHDDVAWWSYFKKKRAVQQFGKWADLKYPSTMYLDFPAGSGYLMTYKMVSRLVSASEYLQYYQGEDVSIGLWAAAVVAPTQHHIICWLPSPHCPDGSVLQEQKEPYEIFKIWNDNKEELLKSASVE